jgi:radical SAM enzyme (TIGR01210 family)
VDGKLQSRLKLYMHQWNMSAKKAVTITRATAEQRRIPKAVEVWQDNIDGHPVDERLIVYMRSSGCVFALNTGGCSMCAHCLIGTTLGQPIASEDYVAQFRSAYEAAGPSRFEVVCVYNEGNILNERELPREALKRILSMIRSHGFARRVILESRPEYITNRTAEIVRVAVGPDVQVEVGIGLESVNDMLRNVVMQKALTRPAYERAVLCLRSHNIRPLTYVILKPPFVTEAQALTEAIASGTYAFSVGSSVVSIEPLGVQPFTIVHTLYKAGLYTPARLWTVLEVAKYLSRLGEVRIGGEQFAPVPPERPRNCPRCTERVLASIRHYNLAQNINVFDGLACPCRVLWLQEVGLCDTVVNEETTARAIETALELFGPPFNPHGRFADHEFAGARAPWDAALRQYPPPSSILDALSEQRPSPASRL